MSTAASVHAVTVRTGPNIAVVKYWGKRDAGPLNLACNASVSLTMDNTDICAQTTVATGAAFTADRLWLNGQEEDVKAGGRIANVLAQVRARCTDAAAAAQKIHIGSRNSFPTAAGLASSAAGLAAVTVAVAALLGVQDSYPGELTTIARMGSGSACRSLDGGLVKWHLGAKADGTDSVAEQLAPETHWPIDMTILVATAARKHTSSTSGMQNSIKTSALMAHRVAHVVDDRIEKLTEAFLARDFDTFGRITMQDSNQFHAICLDSFPPIFYMNDVSKQICRLVAAINQVAGTIIAAYTFDAGPNAVVFSEPANTERVRALFAHFLSLPATPGFEGKLSQEQVDAVGAAFGFAPLPAGQVEKTYLTRVGSGPLVLDHSSGAGDKRLRPLLDLATGEPVEGEFSLVLGDGGGGGGAAATADDVTAAAAKAE